MDEKNPVVKPTIVMEPGVVTKERLCPMYKVILHNDDVNSMDHVVGSLIHIFRFQVQQAVAIMLEAHLSGVALCKVEPLEHAEFHQEQLQSYSLTATIEPA